MLHTVSMYNVYVYNSGRIQDFWRERARIINKSLFSELVNAMGARFRSKQNRSNFQVFFFMHFKRVLDYFGIYIANKWAPPAPLESASDLKFTLLSVLNLLILFTSSILITYLNFSNRDNGGFKGNFKRINMQYKCPFFFLCNFLFTYYDLFSFKTFHKSSIRFLFVIPAST